MLLCFLTLQLGTAEAYAQNRMSVRGNLQRAMSLIRCLHTLESLLFPSWISKKILKRVPKLSFSSQIQRLQIYSLILIG